jgi:Rrf2 family protein
MQLTRAADYAVRAMIHLANSDAGRSSLSELADAAGVSPAFLSKVLQRLVHAELIASYRGKKGGFELLERGRAASLYDILQAADGLPELNVCLLPDGCSRTRTCAAHVIWQECQSKIREILSAATLQNLVCETRALQAALRQAGSDREV